MSFKKSFALIALASTMGACAVASASTLSIDFETMPGADGKFGTADDTPMANTFLAAMRNQLTPAGVTFTQGSLAQADFFDGNPANHFLSSTNPIGTFSIPVFGISIQSYSNWNATLTAYDSAGNVLASDRVLNSTFQTQRDTLSIVTTKAIASFSILPDDSNQILNLDNMVLTVSAVPEPSSWALFAGGLALLGWRSRRRVETPTN